MITWSVTKCNLKNDNFQSVCDEYILVFFYLQFTNFVQSPISTAFHVCSKAAGVNQLPATTSCLFLYPHPFHTRWYTQTHAPQPPTYESIEVACPATADCVGGAGRQLIGFQQQRAEAAKALWARAFKCSVTTGQRKTTEAFPSQSLYADLHIETQTQIFLLYPGVKWR